MPRPCLCKDIGVKSQYSYNVSITSLLTELKWAPLADRRRITKLCLLHKVHTGAVNLNFKRDFDIDYSTRTTRTGSWINPDGQLVNHKLHRTPTDKTPLQKSAMVSTIPTWNNLPGDIIAKSTTDTFRSALERYP